LNRSASVAPAAVFCVAVDLAEGASCARADRERNANVATAQIDKMLAITNKLVRGLDLGIGKVFL
jgi:hypothetical protein